MRVCRIFASLRGRVVVDDHAQECTESARACLHIMVMHHSRAALYGYCGKRALEVSESLPCSPKCIACFCRLTIGEMSGMSYSGALHGRTVRARFSGADDAKQATNFFTQHKRDKTYHSTTSPPPNMRAGKLFMPNTQLQQPHPHVSNAQNFPPACGAIRCVAAGRQLTFKIVCVHSSISRRLRESQHVGQCTASR